MKRRTARVSLFVCKVIVIMCIAYSNRLIFSFAAEAYKKEFDKLTHQFENAKKVQMKALEDASTFDFAKHQLTGARIGFKLLFEAVEEGIEQYPVAGCDDIHQYIEKMSRNTITKVLLMIQNLGVEDNPHFRGAPLRRRRRNKSKDSLIVRVVEAFTSLLFQYRSRT